MGPEGRQGRHGEEEGCGGGLRSRGVGNSWGRGLWHVSGAEEGEATGKPSWLSLALFQSAFIQIEIVPKRISWIGKSKILKCPISQLS